MDTKELEDILNRISETSTLGVDAFLGVFAWDQLPRVKIEQETWYCIVNCCPISQPGIHWLCLFYENGTLEFFDSFGMPPTFYTGIAEFITSQAPRNVFFSTNTLQSYESDACGPYCVNYIFFRQIGFPAPVVILGFYVLDPSTRDEVTKCFMRSL